MNWKWTALVSGTGLMATWFGAASTPNRTATAVAPAATSTVVSRSAHDIQEQAAHLQAAMRAHAEYTPPVRNPFVFARRPEHRAVAMPASQGATEIAPIVSAAPTRPAIRLTGIASDTVDGVLQHTAVLSTSSDVLLLKEGESGGGYTVKTIDENSVELLGPDAAPIRLTFRP